MPEPQQQQQLEQTKADLRLGQVLIDIGMVSNDDLGYALHLAREVGLPVGRVLVMSAFVSEENLQAAVQLQSLLKDQLVDQNTALQVAAMLLQSRMSLEEALGKVGWIHPGEVSGNKLGELLVEGGYVTPHQLQDALVKSRSSGVPFGRLLVLNMVLPEALLSSALNAQILIRDGKVTKEQAIQGLKAAKDRQVSVELPLIERGYYRLPARHTIRLGELLVLAGLMTETDLMYAVEIGLLNNKPIGQVLVELQYISKDVLSASLEFQTKVASGEITPLWAAHRLTEIYHYGAGSSSTSSISDDTTRAPATTVSLSKFLSLVGVVTEEDIKKAIELSVENPQVLGRMLLMAGCIDESTLKSALRCYSLVREGILGTEQAFIAFNYSQQSGISVDDALQELGVVRG
ncbi:MAG: hypothetical protein K2X93_05815 [Candidatus Obscuribacterales bacterium]|nr:hypothetical protein [Candidatus Obscuribacterales bacterium]